MSSHKLTELVSSLASEVWTFELQELENLAVQEHGTWTSSILCLKYNMYRLVDLDWDDDDDVVGEISEGEEGVSENGNGDNEEVETSVEGDGR